MRRIDPLEVLIRSDLDLSQPFSATMAEQSGNARRYRTALVESDLLQRPIRGVFHGSHLPDSLELRVACLKLVVPPDAVVTDRTAGWLHGAPMILAPGDHLTVPMVCAFQPPGKRLRNGVSASGERGLGQRDVLQIDGLSVTSPLRTACDLGRLLGRDSAFAALDSMLRLGRFSLDELVVETERFRGYRGVRQLRAFAPLSDAGSESFGESVLRLRWYDAAIAVKPETQIEVWSPEDGRLARIDVGSRERRYAAEYDGEAFHGATQEVHDRTRRDWLGDQGWEVDVFRRSDLFGRSQSACERLTAGFRRASLACA